MICNKKKTICAIMFSAFTFSSFTILANEAVETSKNPAPAPAIGHPSDAEKKERVAQVFRGGKHLEMYNFVSKEKEVIADPMTLTKEKAKEFLPPIQEIQQIFDIYAQDHPAYAALISAYTDLKNSIPQDGVDKAGGSELAK